MEPIQILELIKEDIRDKFDGDPLMMRTMNLVITEYKARSERLHKHGVVRGGVIEAQSLPLRPEDLEWVNSCVTQITPTEPLPAEVLALTVCVDLTEHDYEPIGNQMWRCQKCGNEIRG